MKNQKFQKLMLAGVACGMAVSAQVSAHTANSGETILLAAGGCGHNGGGCGGHATNNTTPKNGNGCSSPTRDNSIAAEDEGTVRSGNGCAGAPSNGSANKAREYERAGKPQNVNPQDY